MTKKASSFPSHDGCIHVESVVLTTNCLNHLWAGGVVAVAKHMVKGLVVPKNPTDDVMFCLSTNNPRLTPNSSPKTGDEEEKSDGGDEEDEELMIVSVEGIIRRSNSSSSASGMIEIDYLCVINDAIAVVGHSARASTIVRGKCNIPLLVRQPAYWKPELQSEAKFQRKQT
jgi:hypothetical protein